MSVCLPIATREVVFREHYPDGLRDTLACGHVVYATSLREAKQEWAHALCIDRAKHGFSGQGRLA